MPGETLPVDREQRDEDRTMISAAFPYGKRYRTVEGQQMAYVEVGEGDPIVFLHGNPTSSYLWRNVIPHLERHGRCIAPDLVGMGDSAKLPQSGPDAYTFVEHRRYLDGLLDALGVRERVTLVLHDWGSALGFDWANRHRAAVRGLAYMEAIVGSRTWDTFPAQARPLFQALRSQAGETMILEQNAFVEQILPGGILRPLSAEEMAEYRRPFAERGEGRRPTLTWPRQIPIGGEPADVMAIVTAYGDWLAASPVPKLFVKGEPGAILGDGALVRFCRTWSAQREATVQGIHFLQEDAPDEIGRAIATWLAQLRSQDTEM
jgi:haloalkane dehalogenase